MVDVHKKTPTKLRLLQDVWSFDNKKQAITYRMQKQFSNTPCNSFTTHALHSDGADAIHLFILLLQNECGQNYGDGLL